MSESVLRAETRRHLVRVGRTPVLEVVITYPVWAPEPRPSEAEERFNEGYRAMAEAFFQWSLGEPAQRAQEAFASAGPRAVYTFDRRRIECRMTVEGDIPEVAAAEAEDGPPSHFCVVREVVIGSRRGSVPTRRSRGRDVWRLPGLFLTSR